MTREEAIKWLEETKFGGKILHDNTVIQVCDMAVAALREQDERRWVPVTERLPDSDGFYIVVMNGDIWGEPDVWSSTACGFYSGKWDEDDATISHWMPMPEPPKEDA